MSRKILEIEKEAIRKGFIREFKNRTHVGAFEIFIVLAAFSKDNKNVQIRIQEIQRATGYSTYKIIRCLKSLEAAGFIERRNPNVRKKASIYTFTALLRTDDKIRKDD